MQWNGAEPWECMLSCEWCQGEGHVENLQEGKLIKKAGHAEIDLKNWFQIQEKAEGYAYSSLAIRTIML